LRHGRLVELGTHAQLAQSGGYYAELYGEYARSQLGSADDPSAAAAFVA